MCLDGGARAGGAGLQAIADAGADDAALVRDQLETMTFHGVTGTLTVDTSHNPIKTGVVMAVRQGGVQFQAAIDP